MNSELDPLRVTDLLEAKITLALAEIWMMSTPPPSPALSNVIDLLVGAKECTQKLRQLIPEEPKAPALSQNRADVNRENLTRLLEENDWNIAKVSRELGVTRRTLYLRLAAFGITRKIVPRLAKPLK